MTKENSGTVALFGCLGLIPVVILGYILRGWALVTLWGWFLTPVFHVNPPNAAIAIGLGMLGSMLSGTDHFSSSSDSDSEQSALSKLLIVWGKIICGPPFILGIAWIVRQWV